MPSLPMNSFYRAGRLEALFSNECPGPPLHYCVPNLSLNMHRHGRRLYASRFHNTKGMFLYALPSLNLCINSIDRCVDGPRHSCKNVSNERGFKCLCRSVYWMGPYVCSAIADPQTLFPCRGLHKMYASYYKPEAWVAAAPKLHCFSKTEDYSILRLFIEIPNTQASHKD